MVELQGQYTLQGKLYEKAAGEAEKISIQATQAGIAAEKEKVNSEIHECVYQYEEVEAEYHKTEGEVKATIAQKHQVEREKASLEVEISYLGYKECLETLKETFTSLRIGISLPTYLAYNGTQTPLTRQVLSYGALNFTFIEDVRMATMTFKVREYYNDRVDLDNPVSVTAQQKISPTIEVFVPIKTGTKPINHAGPPFILELKEAVPTFTLQCAQTASLANQGNGR